MFVKNIIVKIIIAFLITLMWGCALHLNNSI